jgi:hypothetical protein
MEGEWGWEERQRDNIYLTWFLCEVMKFTSFLWEFLLRSFFISTNLLQVRFLARSFAVPGNHLGQQSHGFRWPYGPVRILFIFKLVYPVLKTEIRVLVILSQWIFLFQNYQLP